jgi:hypothetical protein
MTLLMAFLPNEFVLCYADVQQGSMVFPSILNVLPVLNGGIIRSGGEEETIGIRPNQEYHLLIGKKQ